MTRTRVGAIGLAVLALAMWLLTVHDADYSKMGQLGLVSILGWTYYVGLTFERDCGRRGYSCLSSFWLCISSELRQPSNRLLRSLTLFDTLASSNSSINTGTPFRTT